METINIIDLELAPVGNQPCVISKVAEGKVKDKRGRETDAYLVEAILAATRQDGIPFVVPKIYKQNQKGLKGLIADAVRLRGGKTFTTDELKKFNAKAELFGKSCFASVGRATENKKTVACITVFMPDPSCTVKLPSASQAPA